MNYGEYIRHHRIQAGLSPRQLAEALGISPATLGEAERGHKPLARRHWDTVAELCPTFDLGALRKLMAFRAMERACEAYEDALTDMHKLR